MKRSHAGTLFEDVKNTTLSKRAPVATTPPACFLEGSCFSPYCCRCAFSCTACRIRHAEMHPSAGLCAACEQRARLVRASPAHVSRACARCCCKSPRRHHPPRSRRAAAATRHAGREAAPPRSGADADDNRRVESRFPFVFLRVCARDGRDAARDRVGVSRLSPRRSLVYICADADVMADVMRGILAAPA